MNKYRIVNQIYCFQDPYDNPLSTPVATYAVQVRKWYGWVSVKEFHNGSERGQAQRKAEELLEHLNSGNE